MLLLAAALALCPGAEAAEVAEAPVAAAPVAYDAVRYDKSLRLRKAGVITGAVGGGLAAAGLGVAYLGEGWGALGGLILLGGAGAVTATVGEGLFVGSAVGSAKATGAAPGWGNAAAIVYGAGLGGGVLLNQAASVRAATRYDSADPMVRVLSLTGTSMVGVALVAPWFLADAQHRRSAAVAPGQARLDLRVVPTRDGVTVAGSF